MVKNDTLLPVEPYAWQGCHYLRVMSDGYEIVTRFRGGSGKTQKFAWSVYDPSGKEIASGEELGTERHANAVANKAKLDHFMKSRRK